MNGMQMPTEDDPRTGNTFTYYACLVCGASLAHREPSYYTLNLNHRHGAVIYTMVKVGTIPQFAYEE